MTNAVAEETVATPSNVRGASETTVAARAFVAAHRAEADALGRDLADLVQDPEGFLAALGEGLRRLADPAYRRGLDIVVPGIGPAFGVRNPLQTAMRSAVGRRVRRVSPGVLLLLADRLAREPDAEIRWLSIWLAGRVLRQDPERGWQLLRRHARHAGEWVTVDTLAWWFGKGILDEAYRWAELEQLVYSPSRWERRLVGSTLAELPFVDRSRGRDPDVASRGLTLLGELIGDNEPDVQKALSWALRSLTRVDPDAVTAFCEREAATARRANDGSRAWVIRDALPSLSAPQATTLRAMLDGIRRRPHAASTSSAAAASLAFLEGSGLPAASTLPEPPL